LKELFNEFDISGQGAIAKSEFQLAMTGERLLRLRKLFGNAEESWQEMWVRIDADNSDDVTLEEFRAAAKRYPVEKALEKDLGRVALANSGLEQ